MHKYLALAIVCLGAALTVDNPAQAQSPTGYDFTNIGVPSGGATFGLGINNAGQILGWFSDSAGNCANGCSFLYSDGRFTTINVPGATFTYASGINDAGQIVGWYDKGNRVHGFLYSAGSFSTIDRPGATVTELYGINNSGDIIGSMGASIDDASLSIDNFVYRDGAFTAINVPSAILSQVYGINDVGQIVGTFKNSAGYHGFLYSDGRFTTIDVPGAVGNTEIFGINNSGDMIGWAAGGVVYTRGTFLVINDPGTLQSDGIGTRPQGINDAGQITGSCVCQTGSYAFIATPDAPIAADQFAQTTPDTPITIDLIAGALDDVAPSAELVGTPAHGTVSGLPGTTVTFTPAKDYVGDTPDFQFKLTTAHGASNTATAAVTVVPTLFSAETKATCLSVSDSTGDVSAAFDGAAIALEGGSAKAVAIDTTVYAAWDVFFQIVSRNDELFGQSLGLSKGISDFAKQALARFTKTNPLSIAMEVDSLVFSSVSLLSTICAKDPPDSNYKVVALPQYPPVFPTGNATVDNLQIDYNKYIGLSAATVHAAERWQGAILANAPAYIALQKKAFDKYSVQMTAAKNRLKADNLKMANALSSVSINSFPGGAKAMAAAFHAVCWSALPSDLNSALLVLKVSQDEINQMVCRYANSITSANVTTDFKKALAVAIP